MKTSESKSQTESSHASSVFTDTEENQFFPSVSQQYDSFFNFYTTSETAKVSESETKLPSKLKYGLESLSGQDLSSVRVYRNSFKPEKINAKAYTQGETIFLAPGQEKHLPHEAWHVVQQLEGRVKETKNKNGISLNEEEGLESEANVMGNKAHNFKLIQKPGINSDENKNNSKPKKLAKAGRVIQKVETGSVQTSAGVQGIEGMRITSSISDMRLRLNAGTYRINTKIDEWARENFGHVADSLENAAESFENWYAGRTSSGSPNIVYDVVMAGLGILGAAYPPAGITAAILAGALSIENSALNASRQAQKGEEDNMALYIEQAMLNKARNLRNSSGNFAAQLKLQAESTWNNVGLALTMNDPNMEPIAKEQLYRELRWPSLDQDFTEPALTDMILTYIDWERKTGLEESTFFVSSEDIEWAILNNYQRREQAASQARSQLEIDE